jgi:hypothetical protein
MECRRPCLQAKQEYCWSHSAHHRTRIVITHGVLDNLSGRRDAGSTLVAWRALPFSICDMLKYTLARCTLRLTRLSTRTGSFLPERLRDRN